MKTLTTQKSSDGDYPDKSSDEICSSAQPVNPLDPEKMPGSAGDDEAILSRSNQVSFKSYLDVP